uniref:Dolichyl-diphosphooligosaccharide-protein glycosyltransferase subunit OST5 n=1 Tax=Leersia perrieri TaxID=77586 RepID=A0A0D9WRC2_9ORYZ
MPINYRSPFPSNPTSWAGPVNPLHISSYLGHRIQSNGPRPSQRLPKQVGRLVSSLLRPLLARLLATDRRGGDEGDGEERLRSGEMVAKAISSPVPVDWYPTLAVVMVAVGLMFTASFFIYEATSSRRSRSLAKEIATAAIASVFLKPVGTNKT